MLALRSLRAVRFALLITGATGVASCGGSTDGDGSAGGTNSGGGANMGGTGGVYGTCLGSPPYCVPMSCSGEAPVFAWCTDTTWMCAPGHVFVDKCPPDSCFTPPTTYCCDAEGNQHPPICPHITAPTCEPGLTLSTHGAPCPQPPGCEVSGCNADELCTFADHQCGASKPGVCAAQPQACDDVLEPVCGCDGVIYPNECSAHQAGVDLGVDCTPPAGSQLCGTRLCEVGLEYCEVAAGEQAFTCKPLPPGCGSSPSCACLSGEPCGALCSPGGDGSFKLTCQ